MRIVQEEGIAALSMSALAQHAGVSRQTLYNYFPDVDAVLTGLVEMGDGGTDELAARLSAAPDPRSSLALFVRIVVASVAAGHPSPVALTAALPTSHREALAVHQRDAESLVRRILREGREEGVFRGDIDLELDGRILYRAVFAGAELAREPEADADRIAWHLARDVLAMVDADDAADLPG
jgi:AcrR family transcriptional regulator